MNFKKTLSLLLLIGITSIFAFDSQNAVGILQQQPRLKSGTKVKIKIDAEHLADKLKPGTVGRIVKIDRTVLPATSTLRKMDRS